MAACSGLASFLAPCDWRRAWQRKRRRRRAGAESCCRPGRRRRGPGAPLSAPCRGSRGPGRARHCAKAPSRRRPGRGPPMAECVCSSTATPRRWRRACSGRRRESARRGGLRPAGTRGSGRGLPATRPGARPGAGGYVPGRGPGRLTGRGPRGAPGPTVAALWRGAMPPSPWAPGRAPGADGKESPGPSPPRSQGMRSRMRRHRSQRQPACCSALSVALDPRSSWILTPSRVAVRTDCLSPRLWNSACCDLDWR